MSNGWIKLHRKLLQWEWYEDTNTFRVFMHLMLNANHAERKWQGNIIAPGQLITSTAHIAKPLRLSTQQVRTALKKLENTQEITIKTTNKFTLVTLLQWELHQIDEAQVTNKPTNEQQTNNKQITIKQQTNNNKQECKELKNVKNVRKEIHFGTWPSLPNEDLLRDWKKVRTTKKAAWTQTAVNGMAKELHKAQAAGMSVNECLTLCIERSWTSFKYEWAVNAKTPSRSYAPKPDKTTETIDETKARWAARIARMDNADTITVEKDVTP